MHHPIIPARRMKFMKRAGEHPPAFIPMIRGTNNITAAKAAITVMLPYDEKK